MKIMLKNTSQQKNNMIYVRKLEWLYQSKVYFSLVSICNCKMGYYASRDFRQQQQQQHLFKHDKITVELMWSCI